MALIVLDFANCFMRRETVVINSTRRRNRYISRVMNGRSYLPIVDRNLIRKFLAYSVQSMGATQLRRLSERRYFEVFS